MLSRTTTLLWTCRESNPDPFPAMERFYRYTMGPCVERVPVYYGPFIEEISCRAVRVKGQHAQPCQTRLHAR
jgi:hypothetical protein